MANVSRLIKVENIGIGRSSPLVFILGPCVIESRDHALFMGDALAKMADSLSIPIIFKSSYDKANRSSLNSFRGPGIEDGLKILDEVKTQTGLPILSDVHSPEEAVVAGNVLDLIQIPAFLCRQTDLLLAAGKTGKPVVVKKGQFMAPEDMKNVVEKVASTGNKQVAVTERGSSFGYHRLVVDMRSLGIMRSQGWPVIFDATHSVQLPTAEGQYSGGERQFVSLLARAAVAAGVDAVYMEVHDKPDQALCDGKNMLKLDDLEQLIKKLVQLHEVTA